jgi:hypothetical protein
VGAVQVTPAAFTSFITVAVNAKDCLSTNPVALGEIVTLIADGGFTAVTVTVADADFVPSVTDVAVSVTVAGLGTFAGALYVIAVPGALVVADNVPHPFAVAQDAAQVTPFAALSLLTVAVKLCAALVGTDAVGGDTATATVVSPPPPPVLALPPHPAKNPIPATTTAPANNVR